MIQLFIGSKEGIIKDIESHTAQVLPVKAVATDSLGRALPMSILTIQKILETVKETVFSREKKGMQKRNSKPNLPGANP